MATQTLVRTLPLGVQTTKAPLVVELPEAATQSFKVGDLVNTASGKVQIIQSAGTSNLGADDLILGMALHDASGVTDTKILVQVFDADTTMILPFRGAVTAVANNYAHASGVMTGLELRNHTGNIWCVENATSNSKVVQLRVHERHAVGDTNGWIVVRFLASELQSMANEA